MREYRRNGIRKALEAFNADNEDVVHSTVLEFRDHLEPELGAFSLGDPKTEQFLLASQVDCYCQIYGLEPHDPAVPCQRNPKTDPPLPIFGKLKLTHPAYSSACMTGIC